MKRYLGLLITVYLILAPLAVGGAEKSKWEDLNFLTTDELKGMQDAQDDFVLVNALSPIEFAEIRIAGSINVPFEKLKNGEAKLSGNKDRKLVFYCKGPKWTKSKKAAGLAVKMGYTNVYVYDEGLPAWIQKGYPTESQITYPKPKIPLVSAADLKEMIDTEPGVSIVDLRDQVDRKLGWIKHSVNIPIVDLQDRYGEIPKEGNVVLLDVYGKQTYTAARYLTSQGYTNLYRLDGGFVNGWVRANYPLEK